MIKRVFLLIFSLLLPCFIVNASTSNTEKPNIVFIFADDMSVKTAGFMGHPIVKTPNLDKLANQGVIFNKAYNMGSWSPAVCIASRTMINSGLSIWHAQQVDKLFTAKKSKKNRKKKSKKQRAAQSSTPVAPKAEPLSAQRIAEQKQITDSFWASRMKKAGYDTYMTGKWHVKAPVEASFDDLGTVRGGMPKQSKERYTRTFDKVADSWSPYDKSMGGFWEGGQHWSETLADESIDYLNSKKSSDKPFFMYLGFNAPHDPRQAPKEYIDMYPLDELAMPKSYQAQNSDMNAMGLLTLKKGRILRDESLGPLPRTKHSTLVNRQEYYALITHLDAQIGRIVEQLKANNQLENTVIIFTADHGLAIGEHGLLGKQNLFEHSMRAPFFLYGKDIPKGETRDAQIYIQDAMATSLDIAQADTQGVDFKSVLPIVQNSQAPGYQKIYGAYLKNQRAIIHHGFKLILYPTEKLVRLFDLNKDPDELTDLSQHIEYAQKMKSLFATLVKEQKEKGDTLNLVAVYPELSN